MSSAEEETEPSMGVVAGVPSWPIASRREEGSSGWPGIERMGWWSRSD